MPGRADTGAWRGRPWRLCCSHRLRPLHCPPVTQGQLMEAPRHPGGVLKGNGGIPKYLGGMHVGTQVSREDGQCKVRSRCPGGGKWRVGPSVQEGPVGTLSKGGPRHCKGALQWDLGVQEGMAGGPRCLEGAHGGTQVSEWGLWGTWGTGCCGGDQDPGIGGGGQ